MTKSDHFVQQTSAPKLNWDQIDTVLLDMDGTLLDLRFDNFFWREHLPTQFAKHQGTTKQVATTHLNALFKAHEGTLNWYCIDFWSETLGLDILELKHALKEQIDIRPHVPQFLEAVKHSGRRLKLVTNAHPNTLALKLEKTGIDKHFTSIVHSHGYHHPKESQRFWSAFGRQYAIQPEQCLFIDDSLAVRRAARIFGITEILAIAQPDSTEDPTHCEEFQTLRCFSDIIPPAQGSVT